MAAAKTAKKRPGRARGYVHADETREKIQATNLVHRLYKIAMGEVVADAAQVNAAKALLNKVLPDLQSIQMQAEVTEAPKVSREPVSVDEWQSQHAPTTTLQ